MSKNTAAREQFASQKARAQHRIQQIIASQPPEEGLPLILQLLDLQTEIEGPSPRWRREAFKNFIRHWHMRYALDDLRMDQTSGEAGGWVSKQLKGTPFGGRPSTMVRAFYEHEKTVAQRRKRKPRGPNRKKYNI